MFVGLGGSYDEILLEVIGTMFLVLVDVNLFHSR